MNLNCRDPRRGVSPAPDALKMGREATTLLGAPRRHSSSDFLGDTRRCCYGNTREGYEIQLILCLARQ